MSTSIDGLVEVLVVATGQVTRVPEDWLDSPVLGARFEKTTRQKIADGDVEPADVADPPTEHDTHAVIDDFAQRAEIDLGEAKTKAEKVAVITEALNARPEPDVEVPVVDPSAQGDGDHNPQDPDGDGPSDETPDAGDEE